MGEIEPFRSKIKFFNLKVCFSFGTGIDNKRNDFNHGKLPSGNMNKIDFTNKMDFFSDLSMDKEKNALKKNWIKWIEC